MGAAEETPPHSIHRETLPGGLLSHLWSLEANLPRGALVAGVALEENRGTSQAGATYDLAEQVVSLRPSWAHRVWSDPLLTCRPGSPWSPFSPLTPGGPWRGNRDWAAGRTERGRGQEGQQGGGEGRQHLPRVPGRLGPGSLVSPADLRAPQVLSVQVAQAVPGAQAREGLRRHPAPPAAPPLILSSRPFCL